MGKLLRVEISGFGGEAVVGSLSREQGDWWLDRQVSDHVLDPDSDPDLDPGVRIGWWHESDDVFHSYGAFDDSLLVSIWFGDDPVREFRRISDFPDVVETQGVWVEDLDPGYYLVGNSGEKGSFWDGRISVSDSDVFDIEDFCLVTDDFQGRRIVVSVRYKGLDLDDFGGGTDGKSFDFGIEVSE